MCNGLNIKSFQSCVSERPGCLVRKKEELVKLVCFKLITEMTRVTMMINVK